MDPVTITAISTLISYWGGKAFDKVFDTTVDEFTKGSVHWLKSLFFKDSKPKEVLEKFEEKPESIARQNAIKATLESELEDNPEAEKYIMELVKAIEVKSGNGIIISNSKNVNTGSISAGGSVITGDNNQMYK